MFSHGSKEGLDSLDPKYLLNELRDSHPESPANLPELKLESKTSIKTAQPVAKRSALGSLIGVGPAPSQSEVMARQEEAMVLGNFTIFWVSKKENDKMYQLLIKLPTMAKVKEAIRDVLPYMNQRLAEEKSDYVLSLDPSQFDFYKAKKNGKAKYDYPSLDLTESLSTTGIQRLTLEEKTPDAVRLRNEHAKNTMVKSTMPGEGSMIENHLVDDQQNYVTETACCCFTVKKKVTRKNTRPEAGDLNKRLLEN